MSPIKLSKVEFIVPIHIFGNIMQSLGAKPLVASQPTRNIVLDVETGIVLIDESRGVPMSNIKCFELMKVEPAAAPVAAPAPAKK